MSSSLNRTYVPAVPPSPKLQKRKIEELKQVFDNFEGAGHTIVALDSLSLHLTYILVVFTGVLLVAILCRVALQSIASTTRYGTKSKRRDPTQRLTSFFTRPVVKHARKLTWLKPARRSRISEKSLLSSSDDTLVAESSALSTADSSGIKSRAGFSFQKFLPNNVWELAARGLAADVRALRYQDPTFDINSLHDRYGTILAAAARSGNVAFISEILTWGPNLLQEGGQFHNVLQSAAYSGNQRVVQMLLDAGARDTSVGGYYGTAVGAACEKGNREMLMVLLAHVRDARQAANTPGGLHGRPLIAAAARGQLEMATTLLSNGADINGVNESDQTALHAAAAEGHLPMVRLLTEHPKQKIKKDHLSPSHGTALHVVSRAGFENIGLLLLENGADPSISDRNLRTTLHEAAKAGLFRLVREILSVDDTFVNAQDNDGNTALHHAAISGHPAIARILIDHNIDVSIADKYDAQALFRAAGCQHPEVVRVLLEDGEADPNATDCFQQTALHGPAEGDDVSVQRYLIRAGANVNAIGAMHRTPLHEACNMGRFYNVQLLLSSPDIDVNIVDNIQTTALSRALASTDGRYKDKCIDMRIPMMLLTYKSLPLFDDSDGNVSDVRPAIDVNLCEGLAIQEAARNGLIDLIREMIDKHAANIHIPGGRYGGALQAAAINGDVPTVELLIQRRANVNLRGGEFGTPLAAAAAFGNVATVRFLLENGADATVRGVGRYGSAMGSVCKALNVKEEGRAKIIQLTEQIKELLRTLGGEITVSSLDLAHLEDRWTQTSSGWMWCAPGEL